MLSDVAWKAGLVSLALVCQYLLTLPSGFDWNTALGTTPTAPARREGGFEFNIGDIVKCLPHRQTIQ